MALRWKINVSTLDQRDISSQVRANITSVRANAEEGSVAMSTIIVDDPDGTLDIPGLKEIYGQETEAALPTFYRGVIADRTISRGETDKSYRTTTARQWAVQMADQNERLSRRVLLGVDANRPAETDVARIQYVMGSPEMSTVGITSSTYINTSGAVAMDAADYRGQTVLSLIDDCAQASGKNYWVMRRDDLGPTTFGLWYDFAGTTAYASTIAISNVAADVDDVTTFAASFDTALARDPSRVYSGVWMPFSGGAVYQQQASTSSNFHARDTTSYSANVKTVAKANARAIRYLTDIDTEEDRITTAIVVPNARVNDLREGHLVSAVFSHLPGYETARDCRVLNRTVTQVSEEFYRIEVELSPQAQAFPLASLHGTATSEWVVLDGSPTYTGFGMPLGSFAGASYVVDGDYNTRNDASFPSGVGIYSGAGTVACLWTIDLGATYVVTYIRWGVGAGEAAGPLSIDPVENVSTGVWRSYVAEVSTDNVTWTQPVATGFWDYVQNIVVVPGVQDEAVWIHRIDLPVPASVRYIRVGRHNYSGGGVWGSPGMETAEVEVWGF